MAAGAERAIRIGVVGPSECGAATARRAEEVGRLIAERRAVLVCGGLGGVMEAAARGARQAGGITVGILPGVREQEANPHIAIPIVTGLGEARNVLVVRSSHAVIAVEGGYGTLSELAFALKLGIPAIGLDTWELGPRGRGGEEIQRAADPADAVARAFGAIGR